MGKITPLLSDFQADRVCEMFASCTVGEIAETLGVSYEMVREYTDSRAFHSLFNQYLGRIHLRTQAAAITELERGLERLVSIATLSDESRDIIAAIKEIRCIALTPLKPPENKSSKQRLKESHTSEADSNVTLDTSMLRKLVLNQSEPDDV